MAYNKDDFSYLKEKFHEILFENNVPAICRLYNNSCGEHIPQACNTANVIHSIRRVLSLPKSNIACSEMSEILILRLDILREYIKNLMNSKSKECKSNSKEYTSGSEEFEEERIIKRWSGFLKHPEGVCFSHRCGNAKDDVVINDAFLKEWDELKRHQKDEKKKELERKSVKFEFPSVEEIEKFFNLCKEKIDKYENEIFSCEKTG